MQIRKYLEKLIPNTSLNIKISDTILLDNELNSFLLITSCPGLEDQGGVFRLTWNQDNKKLDRLSSGDIRGIAFTERTNLFTNINLI
nr:hypothetical protein [Candidatus Pelagibacter bacterium]